MEDKFADIKMFGLMVTVMGLGFMFGMRAPGEYIFEVGQNLAFALIFISSVLSIGIIASKNKKNE